MLWENLGDPKRAKFYGWSGQDQSSWVQLSSLNEIVSGHSACSSSSHVVVILSCISQCYSPPVVITSDPHCQSDVSWYHSNPLCVNSQYVHIFKKNHKKVLSHFLHGSYSQQLESDLFWWCSCSKWAYSTVLWNFPYKSVKVTTW